MKKQTFFTTTVIYFFYFSASSKAQWTQNKVPRNGSPHCEGLGDQVFFPYPYDCTKYWECSNDKLYLYDCPSDLWWHQEISECDYPGDFCDNSTTPTQFPTTKVTTNAPTTPTSQPNCSGIEGPVFYSYPGDCTKYWECYRTTLYLLSCPIGLWWYQEDTRCNFPGDFCYDSTVPTQEPPTTTPYIPPTTPSDNSQPSCDGLGDDAVFFTYTGDCTKYWECAYGKLYLYNCPDGLWWDPQNWKCDFPGDFCVNSTTPTQFPTTKVTTNAPTTPTNQPNCSGIDDPVYYSYPGDCTKYFECYKSTLYILSCPIGLWWYQEHAKCNFPGDFCFDSTIPTQEPPTTTTYVYPTTPSDNSQPNCDGLGDDVVFFSFIGDCAKYWECANGRLYLYNCPDGLWWDPQNWKCDFPGDFCNNSTISTHAPTHETTPVHNTTDNNQPNCDGLGDDEVFFAYIGDCTKYWKCANGKLYLYQCPEGLWWDQQNWKCDFPGDFCNNSTNPTRPPTTEATPNTHATTPHEIVEPDCEGLGDQAFFPYPNDCTKYWECSNDKLYLYDCPGQLWWHQEIQECDYAGDFCDNSTHSPMTKLTTSEPATIPVQNTTDNNQPNCDGFGNKKVFFAYPGDCTKYWECANDKLYLYQCPEGLWWDQQNWKCDFPGDFCDTSIIPTQTPITTPNTHATTLGQNTTQIIEPNCEGLGDQVFFPYPYDCTKYWECSNDKLYLYDCPDNLWWHQEIYECDYAGDFCNNSA